MNSPHLLQEIKQSIHRQDPTAEAYLFGSRARGTHRPDSDWDVLILVNEPEVTHEIEDKFRDVLYELELATGEIISVFIYPKDYWKDALRFSPLYAHVNRDGVRLQ
ncbi:MAG: nucleotidyltransferase domain-containing protein [Tunicatimonas sp.]